MRQTLFFLPHQLGPLPLFGLVSWSMLALLTYAVLILVLNRKHAPWQETVQEGIVNWIVGAGILGFLLPAIETRIGAGTADEMILGLPVRGYGVLLMCGVISAVWVANRRVERQGISREAFMSLSLWTVVIGLLGARLFYVIQKWDELGGETLSSKLWTSFQFTEGGLVVYGGAMGGLIGILIWTVRNRVRPIPLIDAIIPAFFIGLAFGRLGCLLNGCCYGGVCESELPAITFPRGAPAYIDQLESGRLLGMQTGRDTGNGQTIRQVVPGSWAEQHGVQSGQSLNRVDVRILPLDPQLGPLSPPQLEGTVRVDARGVPIPADEFPDRSLPVHPSQIYASISAALLFLWTFWIPDWTRHPGWVFGSGLIAYGILRVLEEIIRVDEAGQFGTSISISQWISIAGISLGIGLLIGTRFGIFAPQRPMDSTPQ